ncbi:hypothetical protein LCGC14_1352870 [marine sediment metagenome]|uniref:Uncharacterized protein n=1 Tax=marine sediment metagenome TaxID=412755 RepID=A0A0F9KWG7_9ZZZZ
MNDNIRTVKEVTYTHNELLGIGSIDKYLKGKGVDVTQIDDLQTVHDPQQNRFYFRLFMKPMV